jgi:hypothetical protein
MKLALIVAKYLRERLQRTESQGLFNQTFSECISADDFKEVSITVKRN